VQNTKNKQNKKKNLENTQHFRKKKIKISGNG